MKKIINLALFITCFSSVVGTGAFGAGDDMDTILEAKPSPKRVNFHCSNPAFWSNTRADRPKVRIGKEGEMVVLSWKGATTPGFVSSQEKLPVERGDKEEIRVLWEIAIENPEYDMVVRPILLQYDAQGKELWPADMVAPECLDQICQSTAPGKFRRIGLTWKPAENAVSISPALEFVGNTVTVKIKSIGVEPAMPKQVWKVNDRPKTRIPDVQYSFDGAKPREDKPVLTAEEVTELLAKRPKAMPRLERGVERTKLFINDKPEPFVIHMSPMAGPKSAYFGEMADAGFKITTITVKTGPAGDSPNSVSNVWLGKGKYNFEPLRESIRYVLSRAPNTYIMFFVVVNVYNDWGVEHPGDVHVNNKGEKGIADWSRVTRYGGPPPSGNEFWEASNHSREFREDAAEMLRAFGKWLDTVPEGKVVIGAYLNGSADGQWLFSYEQEFADYSEGTLKAFREYLREKYADDAALSKAWGMPVTFETAGFPPYDERKRMKGPDLQKPRSPLMSYNGEEARASDYNAFLSVSNTRRQIAFCKAFKEGSNGRMLCGSYWPTLPAAYPLSHCDFYEMLNSPDVNFISRGGLLGAVFHGKLTAGEFDLRNVKSGLDAWLVYDHPFIAKSQAEFRRQVLEGFCRELASGGGFHLWDMWGGWFWHPQTMKILKEGLGMTKYVKDPPPLGDQYVGVFVDDNAANYLACLGQYYLTAAVQRTASQMGWGWASAWERTGLPVRFYVMQDALNPELVVPRVSIFLNPLTMSLEQSEAIKAKFCKDKRVVVYMLAPGLAAPGDTSNPEKITGFKIHEDDRTVNKQLVIKKSNDPLLKGIRPGSLLGLWNEQMQMAWYWNVAASPESAGKVLATYTGTDVPGMLVDRRKDYTAVWIGAPGCISPALIRNFAREAGMTPMVENGSEVIVGAGLLGVVGTAAGGPQRVVLPKGYEIEKCITGQNYQVKDGVLTFALGQGDIFGDVAIFSVKGKKE